MFPSYVSSNSGGSSGTSTSFSVSLGTAGTNRLIVVGVAGRSAGSSAISISSAQLGGVGLTTIGTNQTSLYNISFGALLYIPEASIPAGSSATLSVSLNNTDDVIAGAILLNNAKQTTPSYSSWTNTSNIIDWSNSYSFTPDRLLIDAMTHMFDTGNGTVDSGQTERVDYTVTGRLYMSTEEGSSSPEGMGWSWSNRTKNHVHLITGIEFEAPAGQDNAVLLSAWS